MLLACLTYGVFLQVHLLLTSLKGSEAPHRLTESYFTEQSTQLVCQLICVPLARKAATALESALQSCRRRNTCNCPLHGTHWQPPYIVSSAMSSLASFFDRDRVPKSSSRNWFVLRHLTCSQPVTMVTPHLTGRLCHAGKVWAWRQCLWTGPGEWLCHLFVP